MNSFVLYPPGWFPRPLVPQASTEHPAPRVTFICFTANVYKLGLGADRRVRPHRSSMQFESIQLSGGYPHFKQPLVGAGLCACPGCVMRLCDEGRHGILPLQKLD